MTKSFVDKVTKQLNNNIFLLTTKDETGRDAWYYIWIKASLTQEFQRLIKIEGNMDLDEYGEILESGYGLEPPEKVKKEIAEKYKIKT